jgi:hypothetical protein
MKERPIKSVENSSKSEKKPNEQAGLIFSSTVKIIDPKTGKIILQKRAD